MEQENQILKERFQLSMERIHGIHMECGGKSCSQSAENRETGKTPLCGTKAA